MSAPETPDWIIKYDQANHQSSAGKAIRFLMEKIAVLENSRSDIAQPVKEGENETAATVTDSSGEVRRTFASPQEKLAFDSGYREGCKSTPPKPIVTDDEIEKEGDDYEDKWVDGKDHYYGFIHGARWMRSRLATEQPDNYPDTEADGYVFCGKCGKMK